jgi:hypothetical protein
MAVRTSYGSAGESFRESKMTSNPGVFGGAIGSHRRLRSNGSPAVEAGPPILFYPGFRRASASPLAGAWRN